MDNGDHLVHFYRDEQRLVGAVAGALEEPLRRGAAAILIAAPPHEKMIRARLRADGIDLDDVLAEGRVVFFDADVALAAFMRNGRPLRDAFDDAVGGVVRSALVRFQEVFAFGEMVTLLCEHGAVEAALELEALWNELLTTNAFTLLCAYPSDMFGHDAAVDEFASVCRAHARVVGSAPAPRFDATRRYPASAQALPAVREFVAHTLAAWHREDVTADCQLVATELATNAIVHAASDFSLSLSRSADGVCICVGDASPSAPHPRRVHPLESGGKGMLLVDAFASSWGHEDTDGGKFVWAELTAGAAAR